MRRIENIPKNSQGYVFQASGQIDEAITSFRTALRINPDFLLAHNNLGNALNLAGIKGYIIVLGN